MPSLVTLEVVERSLRPTELESTIREIAQELQQLAVTPHVRELRAKAVTYGRVVSNWATYAPTPPQVQAMLECVSELHDKVTEAKHEANRDVSKVTRRHPGEETKRRAAPLPPGLPPSMEWSASVPDPGFRARPSALPAPTAVSRHEAPTRPPPAFPSSSSTVPPVSAPRPVDGSTDNPVPALLRSRRSR